MQERSLETPIFFFISSPTDKVRITFTIGPRTSYMKVKGHCVIRARRNDVTYKATSGRGKVRGNRHYGKSK